MGWEAGAGAAVTAFLAWLWLVAALPLAPGAVLLPGGFEPGRQPDGNSILLEAPDGLILVDSGRHAEHQQRILAVARARGKPIAAILNTHWHLDHAGGNAEIRAAFPAAELHASRAVEGALTGFLAKSRESALAFLASGKADAATAAEIRGDLAAIDIPESLLPTHPVEASGTRVIAGRRLALHLARHAATEADLWILDEESRLLLAGDLVTLPVPFLDTACPDGWRDSLDALEAAGFDRLVPGHGPVMTRADFHAWRSAFSNLLDCAASDRDDCASGWRKDAGAFLATEDGQRVDEMIAYYLKTRLRVPPEERNRYCG